MLTTSREEHEYLYFRDVVQKYSWSYTFMLKWSSAKEHASHLTGDLLLFTAPGECIPHSWSSRQESCMLFWWVTLTRRLVPTSAIFTSHPGCFFTCWSQRPGHLDLTGQPKRSSKPRHGDKRNSKRKADRRSASTTLFPSLKHQSVTPFPHSPPSQLAFCFPRITGSPTAHTHKSKLLVSLCAPPSRAPHSAPPASQHHAAAVGGFPAFSPPHQAARGPAARASPAPLPAPPPGQCGCWPRPRPACPAPFPPGCRRVSPCSPHRTGGARGGAGSVPKMASIMEGPLSKWTNVMKGWQYRWFVLDYNAGLLSYYTVRGSGGPGGRGAGSPAEAQGGGGEGTRGGVSARAANGEGGGGGHGQWGRKKRRARPMGWRCGEIYRWGRAAVLLLAAGAGVGAALGGSGRWGAFRGGLWRLLQSRAPGCSGTAAVPPCAQFAASAAGRFQSVRRWLYVSVQDFPYLNVKCL